MRTGVSGNRGAQNIVGNVNLSQARQIKCYSCNGGQDNAVDEDEDEPPVQDLALNVDNVFQANECDAFDFDVDEAPTTQTMFMAILSSANPVYDEASLSYDSDTLSKVYDHDNYQDAVCEHHEVHEMHDDVQPICVVDSDVEYTGNSNMILYDQYVKENAEPVVQNNVSYVPNYASIMIINEMHEQTAQRVLVKAHTKVVDASMTAELATYKEQVKLKVFLVKRIFHYLRGTVNMGLWYTKDSGFELTAFLDADYAGCKDTFRSTSGGAQFLGEKLVSWSSKKQDCTSLSTVESEYVSLFACCAQVLWMRTQLTDYGYHFNKILIYCDSKSAIAIS
nr:uncharacterized mitochondrial protein AtMg00810-like [Tanacetum cinerariifolium]